MSRRVAWPDLVAALTIWLCLAPAATAALTARIAKTTGEVLLRKGAGPWADARAADPIEEASELCTGPDSEAVIAFSDGSAVVVNEMTQMKVGTLFSRQDRVKVEVYLRLGEIRAQVKPRATVISDFSIKTPTATASVRGTEIRRVSYLPSEGTKTAVDSGRLLVESARGQSLTSAGDQAQVDPSGDLVTPQEVLEESCRAHVEPEGLTDEEKDQIEDSNQPRVTTPTATNETGADVAGAGTGSGNSALIVRIQVQ